MSEFDIPVNLTFNNHREAGGLIEALDQAKENIIWEQRLTENGTVIVSLLSIENLEESADHEEEV